MTQTRGMVTYYLVRFKLMFLATFLLMLLSSVMESIGVAAFFPVFAAILSDTGEHSDGILGFMNRIVELVPISNNIAAAAVILIAIFLLKNILSLARDVVTAYAGARVTYETQTQIIGKYAAAQYQFHLDNKQGALIYNTMDASEAVGAVLLIVARTISSLLKILAISVVLFSVIPLVALALTGLGVLYYAGVHYLSRRASSSIGESKTRVGTEQLVIANEFFSGFRHILAANAAGAWIKRFSSESRAMCEVRVKEGAWLAWPRPMIELCAVGLMLGMVLMVQRSQSGTIAQSLPAVGVFAVALAQLLPALMAIAGARLEMMMGLPRAKRAYQAITGAVPVRADGDRTMNSFEHAITFENVTFAYQNRDPMLKDVDLTIEKGKVTAIVGQSGAGKTTIINLILGLFYPTSGRIVVDGVALQEFKHHTWLEKIGFVSQDPFIYHGTIADNILLGRSGWSRESVVRAATIANAHGFISELPQGYDTLVGERGMRLSGGQQQRLAIARAVLGEPKILIFDEATSSLDSISEKLVQEAIDKASRDRTVIIVAHRLATIRHADKIIVLQDGQVMEEGNHQELVERKGHYARLVVASR